MRVRLKLRYVAVVVVLLAAGMVAGGGQASAAAGSDDNVVYQIALSSSGQMTVTESDKSRGEAKPGLSSPLVMSGKTRTGVATVITCWVSGAGPAPENNGATVFFSILITCDGGVPALLRVIMDIARYLPGGGYVVEPDSIETCRELNMPSLFCKSQVPCFQAGATYDGYARLFGVDENGVGHEAAWYSPPRWIGCLI